MTKAIIGAGGFGSEIYYSLEPQERVSCVFFVQDKYYSKDQKSYIPILPISSFDPKSYEVIVAIADPRVREMIVKSLPDETKFFSHIHKTAQIHGGDVILGEGAIICAGTIITTNVQIGKHCHLNLITTIGHDNIIGDFFTTAPGVQISGNCKIGNRVYFGTRSCIKQKISVCDDANIGMNAGVVKNISTPGIYIGTPARLLR